jgi:hypothetical protein
VRAAAVCSLLSALCLLVPASALAAPPPIKHVFVIVLENKDYTDTFGPQSKAPYLSKTLTGQGQLLTQYHGIGHESLDNYIAMISGQSPNPQTQADCQFFTEFVPGTIGADGQAMGSGCVYPAAVKTLPDQLEAKGLSWRGYMEDMKTTCRHPVIGARDDTQSAAVGDQYAARHNPFVYFHSIIDRPTCAQNDVPLDRLQGDLAKASSTPNYVFITPNLCNDAHDDPCVDGAPGGLVSADQFLRSYVPLITGSPAYRKDGLLVVTFDESESGAEDCCNEPTGPNTPNNGGPDAGNGGGRTGSVLLSRYVRPGVANDTPYNHYALLRSVEDLFGLAHLGYAGRSDLKPFGDDVYNKAGATPKPPKRPTKPKIHVKGVPAKRCVRGVFRARVKITTGSMDTARVLVDRREITRRHRKSFSVRVGTRRLRAGRHRLVVRVSQKTGPKGRRAVGFRVCR